MTEDKFSDWLGEFLKFSIITMSAVFAGVLLVLFVLTITIGPPKNNAPPKKDEPTVLSNPIKKSNPCRQFLVGKTIFRKCDK